MLLTERRSDRVVLYQISWQQFENILANLGESRSARIAYDNGTLLIETYQSQGIRVFRREVREWVRRQLS